LIKLSQIDESSNALAFLQNILFSELGHCSLIIVNTLNLPKNTYQLSNYCNTEVCPNYTAAEILMPISKLGISEGDFIEQWKLLSQPLLVKRQECQDLFSENNLMSDEALVLPILIDAKIERWVLVLNQETSIQAIDLPKLMLLANFAVVSLARATEKRQLEEITNWREEELKEISRLQHLLLPDPETTIPGIELAFKFQVYKEAGGDYFDITSLADDRASDKPHKFGSIIADVTGHGPSAAVEAAMLDAIIRTYKPDSTELEPPAAVIDYVNTHFFTRKNRGKFITAITFTYEPETKILKYACAGHPYGYVKRGNQLIRLDQASDIPIGVLKDYQWTNHEIQLQRHDIIFVYTDVVIETRDMQKNEFGFERLEQVLINAESCPHCLVDDVADALVAFRDSDELCDDLTLCAIQIFG